MLMIISRTRWERPSKYSVRLPSAGPSTERARDVSFVRGTLLPPPKEKDEIGSGDPPSLDEQENGRPPRAAGYRCRSKLTSGDASLSPRSA